MNITKHGRYLLPALLLGVAAFMSPEWRTDRAARLAATECDGDCHTCGQQIEKTHLISGGVESHWNYPYGCVEVECPNPCLALPGGGGDGEPLAEVLAAAADALQRDDVSTVRAILETDKRLFVNLARGVLQATGCDDDKIVATIAVNERMLAGVLVDDE